MSATPTTPNEEPRLADAWKRMAPVIAAAPLDAMQPVNLDIMSAVATVLGALPEIRELRQQMEALPGLALENIDRLEDLTLALSHAKALYLTATAPADGLTETTIAGEKLLGNLRGDAEQLARRGWIDGDALRGLTGSTGYKNLALNLQICSAVLRENWPTIQGRCGTDPAELEEAERIAERLLRVVGLREQGPVVLSTVTENRLRAFTLFMQTYDEVRRAVIFLRWQHGDGDEIAPSLFAGRGGRGKKVVAPEPSPAPPTSTSGAATAAPPAPTQAVTTAGAAPAIPAASGAATAAPGGSPFIP